MGTIANEVERALNRVRSQLPRRMTRISVELHKAPIELMHGGPSNPGEPPGVRSGWYRRSFNPSISGGGNSFSAKGESNVNYGPFLENGTHKMAPRPHVDRILQIVEPKAVAILSEPYF